MKRLSLLLVAALGVGVVWAAETKNIPEIYIFQQLFKPWSRTTAQLPTASAWTGYAAYDSTKGALAVSNGSAWVSSGFNALGPVFTAYDFAALSSDVLGRTCDESWAVTAAGAALGDGCVSSSNLGMDGGAALLTEAALTCRVSAANAIKFKLCAQFTDGGSYDLGDAGFYGRILH